MAMVLLEPSRCCIVESVPAVLHVYQCLMRRGKHVRGVVSPRTFRVNVQQRENEEEETVSHGCELPLRYVMWMSSYVQIYRVLDR